MYRIFISVSIPAWAGSVVSKRGLLFFFKHFLCLFPIGLTSYIVCGLEVWFPSVGYCFSLNLKFLAHIIVTDHIRYEIFQRHSCPPTHWLKLKLSALLWSIIAFSFSLLIRSAFIDHHLFEYFVYTHVRLMK